MKVRRPDRSFAHARSLRADQQRATSPTSPITASACWSTSIAPNARRDRRHPVRPRRQAAGHRPCRRARAGHHPARHHAGLRRQPHLDARRARRARLRHRLVGSDARAGDAVAVAAQAQGDAHHRRRRSSASASPARTSSSPSSRKIGAGGRRRPRHRICRQRDPRPVDGRPPHASATCRSRPAAAPAWSRPTTRPSSTSTAGRSRRRAQRGTRRSPSGARCRATTARRSTARSALDAAEIAPMVTWGTSPEDALPITARIPDPASAPDAAKRDGMQRALAYMGLEPGTPIDRDPGRPRLHRLVHQQPHRGPARGGQGRQGPQGADPELGRAGLRPDQGAGRGGRARQDLQGRRLRMARAPAARCASA